MTRLYGKPSGAEYKKRAKQKIEEKLNVMRKIQKFLIDIQK